MSLRHSQKNPIFKDFSKLQTASLAGSGIREDSIETGNFRVVALVVRELLNLRLLQGRGDVLAKHCGCCSALDLSPDIDQYLHALAARVHLFEGSA